MYHKLRRKLMYNTVPKLNESLEFIDIDNVRYKISPNLEKRIKIKNIVLLLSSILVIFIGLYTMDNKFSMLASEASSDDWKSAIIYTFGFMGITFIQFLLINNLFIPKNLNEYVDKK